MKELKKQKGLSFIELVVVLVIVGILAIIAIPSFFTYLQSGNLQQTAQNLYDTLQYAKSEAIKRNTTIFVNFQTGTSWCYGLNVGAACTCSTANSCGLGTVSASAADFSTLTLTNIVGTNFSFEGTHGDTFLSGGGGLVTFTLPADAGSLALTVQIDSAGSLLICSANVSGYSACT